MKIRWTIRKYGIEERNDRGIYYSLFSLDGSTLQFYYSSFYTVLTLWTLSSKQPNIKSASSDGNTKNEIDFIITDKKQIIQDITVLNPFIDWKQS